MIAILLLTHGKLGHEFLSLIKQICGEESHIKAIGIEPSDDIEKKRQEIAATIKSLNQGRGVIIVTDLFGGVPSNIAISFMNQPQIEVLAGMNLPLLIKLARARHQHDLATTSALAQEEGRKYIYSASQILNQSR